MNQDTEPESRGDLEAACAADVMRPSPRTCSPHSTILEAVLIFKDEDCGLVPVVDDGKPIGVVTDRDVALGLARAADIGSRPVTEIMTADPLSVGNDTPIPEVARVLAQNAVRRVLVVDDEGMLQGVIGWTELAPRLSFSTLGAMVAESLISSPIEQR